ncbi:ATP-binding protein [Pseudoxanthobacter sp. M-2]|uniref:AAA family ATPase n=1 Tax=Pseudoxanthobacter sp. M-2 TaxID=3078754 RepID=UPI0038FC08CC
MTNAKQILALLRSRAEGDDDAFFSIALQVAAAEARQGHKSTAEEMRAEIERARGRKPRGPSVPIAIGQPRGSLEGLIELREPRFRMKDLVLADKLVGRISDVVLQQRKRQWLREHGRVPSRRLLFVGAPGTGKTMSAEALAGELHLPLFVIRLDGLITRFMGETAVKLRLVFDETARRRGVYLFDEFDAVGGHRTTPNDVAEMRRVLNSFLQFMEEASPTDSLIVCATNHPELLDRALIRRYDQVLEFLPPTREQIRSLIVNHLRPMKGPRIAWEKVCDAARLLSQSEIVGATDDAVKSAILNERKSISTDDIVKRLIDRHDMRVTFMEKHP